MKAIYNCQDALKMLHYFQSIFSFAPLGVSKSHLIFYKRNPCFKNHIYSGSP